MRSEATCLTVRRAPGAAIVAAPSRCPPSKTWTTGPDTEAGFVLAEGDVAAVRTAGPFEVPWAVARLPDGSFLVTERPGRLQHVRPQADTNPVSGTPPVLYLGHGGLLDVALDPEFAENGIIYLSFLQGEELASTVKVLRARFDAEQERLVHQQVIFEGSPGPRPEMLGGRMALTGDGYLFLALGDRWDTASAQDLPNTAGSIVRIKTDGSVPVDNPFRGTPGARPEIWSYGHRNPQGLAFDRATGELWSDEHGPQGGDELNLIVRGGNYGWPLATFGVDYSGRPIAVNSDSRAPNCPCIIGCRSRSRLRALRSRPSPPLPRSGSALWRAKWWCNSASPTIACCASNACCATILAASATCASIRAACSMC